jgi:hypothetical protein
MIKRKLKLSDMSDDAFDAMQRVYDIVRDDFANLADLERRKYAKSVFDRAFWDEEERDE